MTEYNVYDKSTGAFITSYRSPDDQPINIAGYSFDLYDHQAQIDKPIVNTINVSSQYDALIDIGPYFDRFAGAKLNVLASTDNLVQAIIRDASVRKWIDLKRPEVQQAVNYIASKVSQVNADIVKAVLAVPVLPQENAVLRASGFI